MSLCLTRPLAHVQLDVEPLARPPLTVEFEIPYFTVSGIQVRYLKIVEKSGYQALPWVHYTDGTAMIIGGYRQWYMLPAINYCNPSLRTAVEKGNALHSHADVGVPSDSWLSGRGVPEETYFWYRIIFPVV